MGAYKDGCYGEEFLTEGEDGLIKVYTFHVASNEFGEWVKLDKSVVVQKILREKLEQHRRKKV